jgi:carbonic anhydrase/acetyltransferase-like protein (isoleucine patch superfamily)
LIRGNWGPISPGSRLLQILYANYLEPFSCNRVAAQLRHYSKVPNHIHTGLQVNCDYMGETAALIGQVMMGMGSVVMEGATLRADQNVIYVHEGVQVMENVYMITDAPTTLHHYQRGEAMNPYQTMELIEGVVRICMNTTIEPNCILESCLIGPFNRIGHNTKIMKGVVTGVVVWILPGSVVLQNTHMHDGELWGGAPARKLGKVSKFEWKKPFFHSILHREMAAESHAEASRYGDQVAYHQEAVDKLETLMVQFEHDVSEGVKAKVRDFVSGREPYEHALARMTQGWTPSRGEYQDMNTPCVNLNLHRQHNADAESEYSGTWFNWKEFASEKRW